MLAIRLIVRIRCKSIRSKLFQVLEGLGIHVILDVPDDVAHYLDESMRSEIKP